MNSSASAAGDPTQSLWVSALAVLDVYKGVASVNLTARARLDVLVDACTIEPVDAATARVVGIAAGADGEPAELLHSIRMAVHYRAILITASDRTVNLAPKAVPVLDIRRTF